jgi:hypothetical protein
MLVGFPLLRKRRKAWENLYGSLESINGPWICFVDLMGDAEGTTKGYIYYARRSKEQPRLSKN